LSKIDTHKRWLVPGYERLQAHIILVSAALPHENLADFLMKY